jgi:plasmid replication initiation protein
MVKKKGGSSAELVVAYSNDLNEAYFNGFTAREEKIFFTLLAKMQQHPEILSNPEKHFTFSIRELEEIAGNKAGTFESYAVFLNTMKSLFEKTTAVKINGEKEFTTILFYSWYTIPTFDDGWREREVKIKINRDSIDFVTELTREYTLYRILSYTQLKSKYALRTFRLIEQWSKTCTETPLYDISFFRERLGIPKSYSMGHINEKILPLVKAEINSAGYVFGDIDFELTKIGRRVTHIKIKWERSELEPEKVKKVVRAIEQAEKEQEFHERRASELEAVDSFAADDHTSLAIEAKREHGRLRNWFSQRAKRLFKK